MKLGIIVGTIVAFVAGALAWVLPPHLLGQITAHGGDPIWPWLDDGIWNGMPEVSVPITMAIGFVYGFLFPKRWWIAFLATWWAMPLIIVMDKSPTSHNLLPFDLLFFGAANLPALAAAGVGRLISGRWGPASHVQVEAKVA